MSRRTRGSWRTATILNKVEGCLVGGAVGDAMGAPAEGLHYKFIEKKVGKIQSLLSEHLFWGGKQGGRFTDDTYLAHILVEAIIRKNGRVRAEDYAKALVEHCERLGRVPPQIGHQQHNVERLEYGYPPRLMEGSGLFAWNECVAPMAIYPIGIVNACNPRNAAWDAYDVAKVQQSEEDALHVCSALAAAVAEALKPDASIDSVVEASLAYVGDNTKAVIQKALDLAKRVGDIYGIREPYYKGLLYPQPIRERFKSDSEVHSTSGRNFEIVPCAMAMFYVARGDPRRAILGGANFGRDCDTISGIAGFLSGALKGVEAIPKEWFVRVEEANGVDFHEMARAMHKAALHASEEAELQVKHLKGI